MGDLKRIFEMFYQSENSQANQVVALVGIYKDDGGKDERRN